MGHFIQQLFETLSHPILPLFKAITAIVIDDDIRPAYYTARTGSIYIDPAFLWLSVSEKRTINPKQDFRSGFDDPLDFRQLQRYVKDGKLAYRFGSLTDNSTRELDDIVLLVASLLLHELAHANDFIPPDVYDQLDQNHTVLESAIEFGHHWVSSRLSDRTPLQSDTMFSLADVMYSGATPTLDDLEISASEVGAAFEPDGAGDDYGYTSQYEDLAMLFETAMMKYLFNADYEMAFTNVPDNPNFCNYYRIGWGVRNRVGDEQVKPRAEYAARTLLPTVDFTDFFTSLEGPTEISGTWCISTTTDSEIAEKPSQQPIDPSELLRPYL